VKDVVDVNRPEAAELREKVFRFSIYRPEEDEFRLSLRCRRSRTGSTGR